MYVKIILKPHISLTNERNRPQAKKALEFMLVFYVAAEFKVNPCVLNATHTEWFKIAGWDLERSHCPVICSMTGTAAFPDIMTLQAYVYLTCFSDEDYPSTLLALTFRSLLCHNLSHYLLLRTSYSLLLCGSLLHAWRQLPCHLWVLFSLAVLFPFFLLLN